MEQHVYHTGVSLTSLTPKTESGLEIAAQNVGYRAAAILAWRRSACELCARGSGGEDPIGPCGWVVFVSRACEGGCVHPAMSSV